MRKHCMISFLCVWIASFSSAQVFLELTSDSSLKPGAVLTLSCQDKGYGDDFLSVLKSDLNYSDWMTVHTALKDLFLNESSAKEQFPDSRFLISVIFQGKAVEARVWDLSKGEICYFGKHSSEGKSARIFAHEVNDAIILALTGRPGIASSSIIFAEKSSGKYGLVLVDSDGRNPRTIFSGEFLVNYPRWFPGKEKVLFLSYRNGYPRLESLNIRTKACEVILSEPGLNACASFFQKSEKIAVVLSKSGNPEIYLVNFQGKILSQLTEHPAVDASPSVSPDDAVIAFVSDRDGRTRLWRMNSSGYGVRKIGTPGSYLTTPAWSPDGKLLAYASRRGSSVVIEVYDFKTGATRILTKGFYWCEAPSWAPDSRHIAFTRVEKGEKSVWVVDVGTLSTRRISARGANPSWSMR
ncbi:MAG: LpqB family beta-propeller domain-containing protein [Candidatus Ratteibacteria bacterium]|jgi:TolB protein